MRAQRVFAGRLARCPTCGDNVVIPGQREDAGRRFSVDTRTPIPRERPADAYGDVPRAMALDDEDDEVVERPRKRRPKRKSDHDSSTALVWVGLGLLLFTSLGAVAAAVCWLVITPDSGSEAKKAPPPPAGGLYAIQPPPQPTRASPVTLYIPSPEVSFPARPDSSSATRPEVSAAKRGNGRTGR
jgi:hypothetical protein